MGWDDRPQSQLLKQRQWSVINKNLKLVFDFIDLRARLSQLGTERFQLPKAVRCLPSPVFNPIPPRKPRLRGDCTACLVRPRVHSGTDGIRSTIAVQPARYQSTQPTATVTSKKPLPASFFDTEAVGAYFPLRKEDVRVRIVPTLRRTRSMYIDLPYHSSLSERCQCEGGGLKAQVPGNFAWQAKVKRDPFLRVNTLFRCQMFPSKSRSARKHQARVTWS